MTVGVKPFFTVVDSSVLANWTSPFVNIDTRQNICLDESILDR